MLNQETKRRIDSARDILVGKVPDPKAQVEQITTALIYKFMDDIDKESEEIGGKARFFVNEYEKYSWSKLLDTRLGGFERLNLYVEALLKMPQNPNLPQLFRNILKDAFLPYRDPETLNLFLKEINGFTYEHSEKLGDAFEYLLSVMDSQGDAGQFRTPRHIIDFIVEVVDPKKDDTILDPACGTAGFLISSYKHILKQNTIHRLGDQLTPDEKTKLMQHFMGYDISPDMVRLSLVNMYLHGFPNPNVFEYDTLTSEERWDETYDVIMANPPFMSPKGGIRPHKRFSIQVNRSEVLFVDYIAEHLNIHGRAGVIVPEGIIFQSGIAYKALRKMLVEKYLFAVVSLPAGIFQPYSGVKTSILLMDKQLAKKADSILFVKVENDGFDLGAQRRAIEKNDLTKALYILQKYKQSLQENRNFLDVLSSDEESGLATVVEKAKIAKNGDYNLSGERYKESIVRQHQEWPMVELREVCKIERGASPRPIDKYITNDPTGVNWVKIGDTKNSEKYIVQTAEKITLEGAEKSRKVFVGDFVLSNSMSFGRPYIMKIEGYIHDGWLRLSEDSSRIDKDFMYYILGSDIIREQFERAAIGGVVRNLNSELVRKVEIPLPPLEVQQEIVAELENYQKVIDGARQVVANYKPTLKIDPSWELVELGNVISFVSSGSTPLGGNENYVDKGVLFIRSQNILKGICDFSDAVYITQETHSNMRRSQVKQFDVFLNITGASIGRSALMREPIEANVNQHVAIIRVQKEKLLPEYLVVTLNSDALQKRINDIQNGASRQALNYEQIRQLTIPIPTQEEQKQIVAKIEAEQKRVQATKELVEIFEQKIKAKIAEVWGTDITPNDDNKASSDGTSNQPQSVQRAVIKQAELGLG